MQSSLILTNCNNGAPLPPPHPPDMTWRINAKYAWQFKIYDINFKDRHCQDKVTDKQTNKQAKVWVRFKIFDRGPSVRIAKK